MNTITAELRGKRLIEIGSTALRSRKDLAIDAFLLYLILQVRGGQHKMLDMVLHAGRALEQISQYPSVRFSGNHLEQYFVTLPQEASLVPLKQAIILASPRIPWNLCGHSDSEDLIQLWAATASAVPHTDEIVRSAIEGL